MNVKLQDTRDRLLILRQLKQRFSELNDELQTQIQALSLEQLYALGEALLDSSASTDIFAP
ncbi:hypothetical protein BV375_19660 [Nostoc sp. 106C]|nr:hypothetical protein BV375_19660 [Nostoc sp. 106C]